jgi:hypothetical protein
VAEEEVLNPHKVAVAAQGHQLAEAARKIMQQGHLLTEAARQDHLLMVETRPVHSTQLARNITMQDMHVHLLVHARVWLPDKGVFQLRLK